jgi:hypothetical protein
MTKPGGILAKNMAANCYCILDTGSAGMPCQRLCSGGLLEAQQKPGSWVLMTIRQGKDGWWLARVKCSSGDGWRLEGMVQADNAIGLPVRLVV